MKGWESVGQVEIGDCSPVYLGTAGEIWWVILGLFKSSLSARSSSGLYLQCGIHRLGCPSTRAPTSPPRLEIRLRHACTRTHTHWHTHTQHTHTHTHTQAYAHTHTQAYAHTHTHTHTYALAYTHIHVGTYIVRCRACRGQACCECQ